MRGFEISDAGRRLVAQFPVADLLADLLPKLGEDEVKSFLRQWVAEGIPFAFRECPLIYEHLRSWMGYRLQVEPRNITIIGSARLGWSLSNGQKFGKQYSHESDLDFAIISERLFAHVVADFELWKSKIDRGQERFVDEHGRKSMDVLPANIAQCFIDAYKLDYHRYLQHVVIVTDTESYAWQKLQSTEGAPASRNLSIRVYADFEAFFRQMKLNLDTTLASL
jgi:hypothetical protein